MWLPWSPDGLKSSMERSSARGQSAEDPPDDEARSGDECSGNHYVVGRSGTESSVWIETHALSIAPAPDG